MSDTKMQERCWYCNEPTDRIVDDTPVCLPCEQDNEDYRDQQYITDIDYYTYPVVSDADPGL